MVENQLYGRDFTFDGASSTPDLANIQYIEKQPTINRIDLKESSLYQSIDQGIQKITQILPGINRDSSNFLIDDESIIYNENNDKNAMMVFKNGQDDQILHPKNDD